MVAYVTGATHRQSGQPIKSYIEASRHQNGATDASNVTLTVVNSLSKCPLFGGKTSYSITKSGFYSHVITYNVKTLTFR